MKRSFPIVISITALVVAVLGTTPFGQAAVDGAKVAVAPAKVPLQAVGVIKRGPRGKRGLRGPRGPVGPQGPAGSQGATGPQGVQGPAGSPDTPAQVLAKITHVDGSGSGLDSDK